MKIFINAKPKSRKEYVKRIDALHYSVAVKEPPVSGKANSAIIKSLSDYFHKPTFQISILAGETSRKKIVDIPVSQTELEEMESQKKLF